MQESITLFLWAFGQDYEKYIKSREMQNV